MTDGHSDQQLPTRRRLVLGLVGFAVLVAAVAAGILMSRPDPVREYEQGLAALREDNLDRVRTSVQQLVAFPEYAPHRHYLQGAILLRKNQLVPALDQLAISAQHPDLQVPSLVLSGQAYYQAGHVAEAATLWQRAVELKPDAADAHRWLGVMFYDLGAMEHALAHLGRVSELEPSDPRPDRLMGLINKDYERFDEAIKHYRESLHRDELQPDRNQILLELAESLIEARDYTSALEVIGRVDPSIDTALFQARIQYGLGNVAAARRLVQKRLASSPDDYDALLLYGTVLVEAGEAAEAVELLTQIIEQRPREYKPHLKLAEAYRGLKQDQRAREEMALGEELRSMWQRFAELHQEALAQPDSADLRSEIGDLAIKLDRPELAHDWYRAALAIDPSHEAARRQLQELEQQSGKDRTAADEN